MGKRVLVATDGSELSRRTAQFVARMAQVASIEVHLAQVVDMHVVEYKMLPPQYVDMIREGAKATAEAVLKREADFYAGLGVSVTPRTLFGAPGQAICEVSGEEGYPLVVVGRKGEGGDIQDLLFGSVSNYVVHHCERPVLVVKGRGPIRTGEDARKPLRILAAVDGSAGAQRCIDLIGSVVWAKGADITLLNVIHPDRPELRHLPEELRYDALKALHGEAQSLLDRGAASLRQAGFGVTTRVEEGSPAKTVCRVYQEDGFELAALGRRGLSVLGDAIFGSVSNYVLHHCPGHVLLVP